MLTTELSVEKEVNGADCGRCGGVTRLVGLEDHPVIAATVLTFECKKCGAVEATIAMSEGPTLQYAR
jgi:Zn finger protein HypA/HybF involved in hydrogenase expression